jgi:nucleoside-specific outer membrane channel protein Tsx
MRRDYIFISIVFVLLLVRPAWGEEFSTTNVQLLYGSQFDDRFLGNNTLDGKMTTMTVEHFGTWAYGDNYFFSDFTTGSFVDSAGTSTGSTSHIYGEWAPRLSLSKMLKQSLSVGIFKDFYLAGQVNRSGTGFQAEMIGIGTALDIPAFSVASLHAYSRKDNFNQRTWQVTGVWSAPMGRYFSFEGFADAYGSDNNGTEIIIQPKLLVDVSGWGLDSPHTVQLGIEWYIHRNNNINVSVPQAMVKWIW